MKSIPNKWLGISGHLKRSEGEYLYSAPFRLGDGYYADLGTYKGRSAVLLGGGIKDSGNTAKVYSIDTFDSRTMTSKKGRQTFEIAMKNIEDRGLDKTVNLIKGFTSDIADILSRMKFKLIFIDADHSYDHVKEDFLKWSPLLDLEGEIAFHDSNTPGVSSFLRELSELGWDKKGEILSLTWWKKQ